MADGLCGLFINKIRVKYYFMIAIKNFYLFVIYFNFLFYYPKYGSHVNTQKANLLSEKRKIEKEGQK